MGEPVAACACDHSLIIVLDDSCPVVHRLGLLVRHWDRHHVFTFVGKQSKDLLAQQLKERFAQSSYSLMFVDKDGSCWLGAEAVPFILKNLPSGKLAAVTYTIPGTMWLTRKLYQVVSRHRRYFSAKKEASKYKTA